MAIRGSRGTSVSFHEGNTAKTCIVTASGEDIAIMAEDMMEVANGQNGYCYSDATPRATVQRQSGRIYVTGEGGNAKAVISTMVDALFLP
ncbi:hypothetical protein EXS56_02800 [Candidatus Kaiserbacteria bacterium]|nr:hypothetical protein [Candidatus Kaiserbacteria bacterium]